MHAIRVLVFAIVALANSTATGAELPLAPEPRPVPADPRDAIPVPPDPSDYFAWSKYNSGMWKRAEEHFMKGRYELALECYKRWVPNTGCGTCNQQMSETQHYRMVVCHVHLNDLQAAVRVSLTACRGFGWSSGANAAFLFRAYHRAGQLDDLWKILDEAESLTFDEHDRESSEPLTPGQRESLRIFLPTWPVRELGRIMQLGEKKNAADEKFLKGLPPPVPLPKIKPGSLPRALPK